MKTKNKSRSYNQYQLKALCDKLCDQIEVVLEKLNLEYRKSNKMMIMKCPIHGGDNDSALNLYHEGETYRGNWICRTHGCEKIFQKSILGFLRGCLSHIEYDWSEKGDKFVSFDKTVEFAQSLVGETIDSFHLCDLAINKIQFSNAVNNIYKKNHDSHNSNITRDTILSSLAIPANYFIGRGYSSEILKKYDIGLCTNPQKEMYNRAVAPIYDTDHKYMVGCTGRSIFEKCDKCNRFHSLSVDCPEEGWQLAKWKHSYGFKADSVLYNLWFAKNYIQESYTAIIVESPGNVWKLEESGFHNSVAIFGSSLSDKQKILLDGSGAMNLIILTDSDEAGNKAAERIAEKCEKTYRIYRPVFSANDISCLSTIQIRDLLNPIIEKII